MLLAFQNGRVSIGVNGKHGRHRPHYDREHAALRLLRKLSRQRHDELEYFRAVGRLLSEPVEFAGEIRHLSVVVLLPEEVPEVLPGQVCSRGEQELVQMCSNHLII